MANKIKEVRVAIPPKVPAKPFSEISFLLWHRSLQGLKAR